MKAYFGQITSLHFGAKAQIEKFKEEVEEVVEALEALKKNNYSFDSFEHAVEEVADVLNVVESLYFIFERVSPGLFKKIKQEKQIRTLNRIGEKIMDFIPILERQPPNDEIVEIKGFSIADEIPVYTIGKLVDSSGSKIDKMFTVTHWRLINNDHDICKICGLKVVKIGSHFVHYPDTQSHYPVISSS